MFTELAGQQAVKEKLEGLILSGSVGHAHLFCGAAGTGKRLFARAFAKALLCESGTKGVPLGGTQQYIDVPCCVCEPCRLFESGALDGFLYVEPSGQGGKPTVSVDAVRGVIDWLSTYPLHSSRKVYIISQADHMTEQAQNALLKTLEEPASYAVAILTAENPAQLLETVRSRCALTRFGGCGDDEFEKTDAFLKLRNELMDLFLNFLDGDARAFVMLPSFFEKNRDRFQVLSGTLIQWLRQIWLQTMGGGFSRGLGGGVGNSGGFGDGLGGGAGEAAADARMGAYAGKFLPGALLDCIERVDEANTAVAVNVNFTLAVGAMLSKISRLLNI